MSVLCRCGASFKAPQVSGWLIDFFPLVELTSGIFSFKNDSCTVFLSIVILSMFSFTLRFQEAFPLKSGAKFRPFYLPCKPFKTFFQVKMFDFLAEIYISLWKTDILATEKIFLLGVIFFIINFVKMFIRIFFISFTLYRRWQNIP